MRRAVRQESATFLEWTVNTGPKAYKFFPGYILKTERNFVLPDCNIELEFSIVTSPDAHACLFFKRYDTLLPELQVKVFASWNNNSEKFCAISEKRIKGACEEIWRQEAVKLLGALLTFEIIIYADNSEKDEYLTAGSYSSAEQSMKNLTKEFSELLDLDQKPATEIKHKYSSKAHKKGANANDLKRIIVKDQDTNISRIRKYEKRRNWFKKGHAPDNQLNKSEKYRKQRRRNRRTRTYLSAHKSVKTLSKDSSELPDLDPNCAAEIKYKTSSKDHKNILRAKSNDLKSMLDSGMVGDRVATGELQDTNIRRSMKFKKRRNLCKKNTSHIQPNKSENYRKQRNRRNRRTRRKQNYNQPDQNVFHEWGGYFNPAYAYYPYYG